MQKTLIILLLVLGTVVRLFGLKFTSFIYDTIETQYVWYHTANQIGFSNFWRNYNDKYIDYLPGSIYIGMVLESIDKPYEIVLKSFNFLVAIVFVTVIHLVHKNWRVTLAVYLVPAEWFVSTYWGQIDTWWVFLIYLALVALFHKNKIMISAMILGVAISLKLQPMIFLPVFGWYFWQKRNWQGLRNFIICLGLVWFVINLPALLVNLERTVIVYTQPFLRSNVLSSGAYGLWTWFSRIDPALASRFGTILFVGTMCWLFFKAKEVNLRSALYLAVMLNLAYFLFMTKMHSRYAHLAAIFSVIVATTNLGSIGLNLAYLANQILIFYYVYPAAWYYIFEGVAHKIYIPFIISGLYLWSFLVLFWKSKEFLGVSSRNLINSGK